jgi:hypothetical protein
LAKNINMPENTCITQLVGIVKDDCQCYTGNCTPEQVQAMRTSKSGYFLEDLPGMIPLKGLGNGTACKNMCQFTLDTIPAAEQQTLDDIVSAVGGMYDSAKATYRAVLGETAFTMTLTPTKRYYGYRFVANKGTKDTVAAISDLKVNVTAGGGVQVIIARGPKDGGGVVPLETFIAQSTPGMWSAVNMNAGATGEKVYPLYVNGVEQEYYVLIDSAEMAPGYPVDNLVSCGCGGKDQQINQYVNFTGVQLDNLNNTVAALVSDRAFGVSASIKFFCNEGSFVCREFDSKNPIAVAMAAAVRYKMGFLLLNKVLSSPEVSRYTMMNREQIYGNVKVYEREYQKRISAISVKLDPNKTDCFICNSSTVDLSITHIRV